MSSEKLAALQHAVQSGVQSEISHFGEAAAGCSPKMLRVGVNCALVEGAALARLLISKGIITREEYDGALVDGMQREVAAYEERLSRILGTKVVLV